MAGVLLCVSIDCECDKGPRWRVRRPLTFEGIHTGIARCLQPLFRRFGAKPTYLLSPEILRDERCVEELAGLGSCELGTHLHGELAEPGAFEPDVTRAVQRDYAPELERAKLTWMSDSFRSAFARSARSFRAGRFGIGPHTVPILEDLKYTVESSVTPHVDWSSVSRGLTFWGASTQPYHPDPQNPSQPGTSSLLEVPLTIRPRSLGALPVLRRWVEPRWLRPTRSDGGELIAIACEEIHDTRRSRPGTPVVLNAMLHNVEVIAGASPYASSAAQAEAIVERLAALLQFAVSHDIPCVGLADLPELFEASRE